MAKSPAQWTANPAKQVPAVAYSSSTVTYNSPTTKYSGIDVTLNEFGLAPALWSGSAKTAGAWSTNAAAGANEYAYDGTNLYDSAQTYDGIVTGQQESTTRVPNAWSEA